MKAEPLPEGYWRTHPVKGPMTKLAEKLTIVAIERGLYYTGLYGKLGINLKIGFVKWDKEEMELLLYVVSFPPIRNLGFMDAQIDEMLMHHLVDGNFQHV